MNNYSEDRRRIKEQYDLCDLARALEDQIRSEYPWIREYRQNEAKWRAEAKEAQRKGENWSASLLFEFAQTERERARMQRRFVRKLLRIRREGREEWMRPKFGIRLVVVPREAVTS